MAAQRALPLLSSILLLQAAAEIYRLSALGALPLKANNTVFELSIACVLKLVY